MTTNNLNPNNLKKNLTDRVGLSELSYPVPKHSNNLAYMLGGLTFICILVLIASGVILTQFYNPSTPEAHESLVHLITKVPFGDIIRSIHYWATNLVIILLLFHLVRVFITGSYKRPRELTWYTGLALLLIMFAFIFAGTVIKWDQEGVEALAHLKEILLLFGVNIESLSNLALLTRIYATHVSILPLLLTVLLIAHFFLIKAQGISPQANVEAISRSTKGEGSSNFLTHLQKLIGSGLLLFSLLLLLALVFPAPLGYPGVANTEVTKPVWMFYPLYALEDFFGLPGMIWGSLFFVGFLVLIPLLDRNPYLNWRKRKLMLAIGTLFALIIISLGIYTLVTPSKQHIEARDINLINMEEKRVLPATTNMNNTTRGTQMATAANLQIDRHKSTIELVTVVSLIALSTGLGSLLILKTKQFPTTE